MDAPEPQDKLDKIKQAIFQGRKIEAIKLYREYTGQGLADSKVAIEKLEEELRAKSPEKFASQAKGCLGLLTVFIVSVMLVAAWLLSERMP